MFEFVNDILSGKKQVRNHMSAYMTSFLIKYFKKDARIRCYVVYFKIVPVAIGDYCN